MLTREPPLMLRIDGAPLPAALAASSLAERCVPLVALAGARLSIVASATLWRTGAGRYALSTAAHVFESGLQVGDLGVACAARRRVAWLGAMRPTLKLHGSADVALIRLEAADEIGHEWRWLHCEILFADDRSDAGDAPGHVHCHAVAGWPARDASWTDAGLHARPFVCVTTARDGRPDTYRYGRIADREDGRPVCTPELDGVSGALLWRVDGGDESVSLRPAGVQIAFSHGAYVRCEPIAALSALLRAG